MAGKKQKTTLTILPKNPRPFKRIPKPKVSKTAFDPLSQKGARQKVGQ